MTRSLALCAAMLLTTAVIVHPQSTPSQTQPATAQKPATAGGDFIADWRLLFPDDDPVRQKVIDACSACHELRWVLASRFDQSHWEDTIWTMVANGAKIEPDEAAAMAKYLSTHFAPDKKMLAVPVDINAAPLDQLVLLPSLAPHAPAIVKARDKAPFGAVDDLLNVEGITKEALDKAKPFVVVK